MQITKAPGALFLMPSPTAFITLRLMPSRSSRLMPGLRGTPAVTMTTSEPAQSAQFEVPVTWDASAFTFHFGAPKVLVQAPSNLTGICDRSIQPEIDAALDGSESIDGVIAHVRDTIDDADIAIDVDDRKLDWARGFGATEKARDFFQRPLRGRDGELLGVVGWFRDITEQQQAARAAEEASRALLQALSTPLLPVADGVIVLPLIGVLDPVRIEQVRRTLLAGVVRYQAQVVIVDVTGVEGDETPPLAGLVDSARGVALLGATCMLTGIRPAVARALVERDIDLSGLLILRDLKAGIARALALRAVSPG